MQFWLMKSEPSDFSIDMLEKNKKELWTGVRNYQARNFMKSMNVGDLVLFYHSSVKFPGIVGIAKVSLSAVADPSQFDRSSKYFDSSASKDSPRWFCVEVSFVKKLEKPVFLEKLKSIPKLSSMKLLQKGSRLSVLPVTRLEYELIMGL